MNITTRAEGTPSPDQAVGTVRGGLACIETAAVENALFTILRPVGTGIVEASLQCLPRSGHHVFHLAAPRCLVAFAVYQIPIVAHFEDVRTFQHTVPYHVELSDVLPCLHVAALEFSKLRITAIDRTGADDHVVETIFSHKNLRVAEVYTRVTEVRSVKLPEFIASPGLEVRRGSAHYSLSVLGIAVVPRIIDVVKTILLVVIAAART